MFNKKTSAVAAFAATAGIFTLQGSALAAAYQARCGGLDCTISITGDRISSGGVSMPAHRTTSWTMGGNSKTDVTTGVVTTVLFGPLGLLGFAGKKHDYNFTVNGFDDDGKRQSISFQFINDKPAKQVAAQLPGVTGLAINEKRTEEEILAYEANGGNRLGGGRLGEGVSTALGSTKTKTLGSGTKLAQAAPRNCWSSYLGNNPAMAQWAEANPGPSAQNKKRFDDC